MNLRWALDRVRAARRAARAPTSAPTPRGAEADAIVAEDVAINHAIGEHGLALLREIARRSPGPVRVMTHCNAGALATCGWGTATAPIFLAHAAGLAVHVWVSARRGRGCRAPTSRRGRWRSAAFRYTLFADSASAALMRRGDVDLVLVGADRVARNGDVCNKIGTYDKALAARDNNVPFYVGVPSPTIDWSLASGDAIPIEQRDADEVLRVSGRDDYGHTQVRLDRAARHPGGQLRVRRDACSAGDRARHRARRDAPLDGMARRDVPRARARSAPVTADVDGDEPVLRSAIVAAARAMNAGNFNRGTSGNVSARLGGGSIPGFLVTPSGLRYDEIGPDDVVFVGMDGQARGSRQPSSEWRFHRDIYATRAEAGAVVHTHGPFSAALACHERGIPAFHYMVARAGGRDIRCARYATFGTQALSDHAIAALDGRRACLLAHHGAIALGRTLEAALALAGEVETLAEMYLRALTLGEPPWLADAEMESVLAKFAEYGQPPRA